MLSLPSDASWLYHAAPLHYVPHILRDRALYAASVLAPRGLRPRSTVAQRDRSLGLSDFVHLSLRPDTPLLLDKIQKGYPHVLMAFDRERVLAEPNVALLPYNAKAWKTRAALSPIMEKEKQAALLQAYERGRYPSLEVLVKYGLSLDGLRIVAFLTDKERQQVTQWIEAFRRDCSVTCVTDPKWFGLPDAYRPVTGDAIDAYFDACRAVGDVLPPPAIAFD